MSINHTIFYSLYNIAHQSIFLDKLIVFFAVYFPYIVVACAIIFIIYHKHKIHEHSSLSRSVRFHILEFLTLIFIVFVMWGVFALIKVFVGIPRPFVLFSDIQPLFLPSGYAFPSGHATIFSAIAGTLFVFHKRAGVTFFIFAVIIGIARVFAGVHFPADIVAGLLLGFTGALFLYKFLKK